MGKLIYDLSFAELAAQVAEWNEPAYRTRQVWQGLYQQLYPSPEQFTNLPESLRQRLADTYSFTGLIPVKAITSKDGETIKTLFSIPGKKKGDTPPLAIEAVLMRYSKRRTLCISTQAGCAMGCVFCATGQMGFQRNLSSGEIVEQVLYYARLLAQNNERPSNIVVMGMGEPFHNYNATFTAIDQLNHPDGFNFGARRFTVSTVGLIPSIRRFTKENRQVNLAISLHAAEDPLRSSLLPANHRYPLADLLQACLDYVNTTHRRLTFEWALIRDVNDTPEQARLLAQRLQPFRRSGSALCHVNVIPLNPTRHYAGQATPLLRAQGFKEELEKQGIPCSIRLRRGIDIQAGCGQLAANRP